MTTDSEELVNLTQPEAGIGLIVLNEPHIRNAMTEELTSAWKSAMEEVSQSADIRALVVTGAGTSFCSGADLSWLDQAAIHDITPYRLRERMLPFYRAWLAPRDLPFPVIAAVNGPAVGAGLCLALACDLRYANTAAMFSAPFNYLGTHGGMAITTLLPEAVGLPRAREMLYTGREVHVDEALQWGLVNDIADDVVKLSIDVAARIASAAPIPTSLTKSGLEQFRGGLAASLNWEALAQPLTMATSDLHEGIRAQRERRSPSFKAH